MVRKSITKYSNFFLSSLNALSDHEANQLGSIRKYEVHGKLPRSILPYLRDCGTFKQWCLNKVSLLMNRYRWYGVINLLKLCKAKGLNIVILLALSSNEGALVSYVTNGEYNKNDVIRVLTGELGISGEQAEQLIKGALRQRNAFNAFGWNFLPRSI